MERPDFHIRSATHSDLSGLLDLYQHLSQDDLRPSDADAANILARLKSYPGTAVFIGERGDQVVTSCTLVVVPNFTLGGKPYGLVENVVTHTEFRGRGYGRAILHEAAETAWRHRCYKVMLLSGSQRPETLRFYQQAGFEQSKTGFQMRRHPKRAE